MSKDHIPDWAGGRQCAENLSGWDRVRQIVHDAESVNAESDASSFLTFRQARELLKSLPTPCAYHLTAEHEWACVECEGQQLAEMREQLTAAEGQIAACKANPLIYLDYPTAWRIVKQTDPTQHHEKCSFRQEDGGILCDCAVVKGITIARAEIGALLAAPPVTETTK